MTDLDLTEAVEAAAQALLRHQFPTAHGNWEDIAPLMKYKLREIVLPVVAAAAPLIAEQSGTECGRWAVVLLDVESPCIRPRGHEGDCHPEVHAGSGAP